MLYLQCLYYQISLKVAGLAASRGRTPRRAMTLALMLTSKKLYSEDSQIKALSQSRKQLRFSCLKFVVLVSVILVYWYKALFL